MQNDISQYRAYSNGLSKLFPVPNQFTNNSVDADSLKEQLRQYYDVLIKAGVMFTRSELKKKNLIDLRGICTYECHMGNNDVNSCIPDIYGRRITDDFLWNNFWYCYVPCFNEGVLQINTARYLYWKINKLDVIERVMDIFVCDYSRIADVWQMGTNFNAHFEFDAVESVNKYSKESIRKKISEDHLMRVRLNDYQAPYQIYNIIPCENFNWNSREIELWKNMVASSEGYQRQLETKNTNAGLELLKIFSHFILLSNQELYENKPKADRKTNAAKRKVKIESGEVISSEKLVRVVGHVCVTSEKPPKLPSKETVVKYKTAVWTARGGVRHMKNGKLVPFRESVRHRKCLQQQSADMKAPSTKIIMR